MTFQRMESEFRGKKYLVTGAGSGIGRGLAKQLTDLGAEVWGVSRTKQNLQSLAVSNQTINQNSMLYLLYIGI